MMGGSLGLLPGKPRIEFEDRASLTPVIKLGVVQTIGQSFSGLAPRSAGLIPTGLAARDRVTAVDAASHGPQTPDAPPPRQPGIVFWR